MLQNTNKKYFNQGFIADDQVKFQVLQFKDHRVFHTLDIVHVTFWLHLPPRLSRPMSWQPQKSYYSYNTDVQIWVNLQQMVHRQWLKVWAPNIQFLKPKYSNVKGPSATHYSKIKHCWMSQMWLWQVSDPSTRHKLFQTFHDALVELQHKYSGGNTFTHVMYLCTPVTYFNWVFTCSRGTQFHFSA